MRETFLTDIEGPKDMLDLTVSVYTVSKYVTIERRSFDPENTDHVWAVSSGGLVLTKDLEWMFEPSPSSRTDEFIESARWATASAALAALNAFVERELESDG